MPNRRYPPAYLRYLKARLLNLGRPSFWVTAIFLSVLGLLIQKSWSNPDISTQQRNKVTEPNSVGSGLSAEDRAIAADIDNLRLLLGNSELMNLPATTSNSQDNNSKQQLASVSKKQQFASTQQSNAVSVNINTVTAPENNIFVTQAENLLRFGATDNNQLLGMQSFNPVSEPTNNTVTSSGVGTDVQNLTNSSRNGNSINPSATGFYNTTSSATNSVSNSSGVIQTAPINTAPLQTFSSNTGINSRTTDWQQNTPNLPPNSYTNFNNGQTVSPSMGINSRTADIPQNTPNMLPNSYTNFNNGQTVPSQVQVTSPVITRTSPIIGPYTVRNSSNEVVTPTTSVVPNSDVNSIWQQPNQYP